MLLVKTLFFFFKQKTAYEMRISDWSSDVCSSDLYPMATQDHGRDPKCLRPYQKRPKLRARQHPGSLRHRLVLPKRPARLLSAAERARKSAVSGKRVSVRVDLGGRRLLNNKTNTI